VKVGWANQNHEQTYVKSFFPFFHAVISSTGARVTNFVPSIGFVLDCRADPAGKTRDYISRRVNEEGTFRAGRVSLNADRWERVELAHLCPPKRLFAAVPSLPTSGR
jgi:hypothetical protein